MDELKLIGVGMDHVLKRLRQYNYHRVYCIQDFVVKKLMRGIQTAELINDVY